MSRTQNAPRQSPNSRGTSDHVADILSRREARKYSEALEVGSPYRTTQQTCAILQCSESGLRNLRNRGHLSAYTIDGVGVRFHIEDIEAFVRRCREGGQQ